MELRWRLMLAGLPRTGNVTAGPARRERSGKADPGLAHDLGRGAECLRFSSSIAILELSYVNVRGWWDYPSFYPKCQQP